MQGAVSRRGEVVLPLYRPRRGATLGWSWDLFAPVPFLDHGRSFYAHLYPGGGSAAPLLRVLDSLRVQSRAGV